MPRLFSMTLTVLVATMMVAPTQAQIGTTGVGSFGIKIFKVESGLYPFVQVYIRTFGEDMHPLINLNEKNLGVMVKGQTYDAKKGQYMVQSLRSREEAVRTVFVIDCSKTMEGAPFDAALEAAARFVDLKRPQDQVGILAIRDTAVGYDLVSTFERNPTALGQRLADLRADGNTTRLYDSIGAAMQMCGLVSQGGTSSNDAEYIVSSSIIIFSDGRDEGSALSRSDLTTAITGLEIPIPIYSLAYSKIDPVYLKNLEALSKISFGIYYPIGQAFAQITRSVEDIQTIIQGDYVVTLRAYEAVDGATHPLKIGLEYPSDSGQMIYESDSFEAIAPPQLKPIKERKARFEENLKYLSDHNPYAAPPGQE